MYIVEKPLAGGPDGGHPVRFSSLLTRVNTLIMFVCLAVSVKAASVSSAFGTSTGTGSLTYDTMTGVFSWSRTWNNTTTDWQASLNIVRVAGQGSTTVLESKYGSGSPFGTGSASGTFAQHAANDWYMIEAYCYNGFQGAQAYSRAWIKAAIPAYADFKIPNNLGTETVVVKVWQNGVLITSLNVSPNQGVQTLHVTDLDTSGAVTVTYGYPSYRRDPTTGAITATPDQDTLTAGGLFAPSTASEPPPPTDLLSFRNKPSVGIPKAPVPVPVKTPETNVTAPTAVATPAAPTVITKYVRTSIGVPFGTPSGSSGVTKQDSETIANAVVAAVDSADANRQGAADKQIDATNNVATAVATQTNAQLTAINNLRTETVAVGNKQVNVGNGLQSALEGLRGDVRAGNTLLDSMNLTLGDMAKNTQAPDAGTVSSGINSATSLATSFQTSVATAVAVQPSTGTVASDATTQGEGMGTINLPTGAGSPTFVVSLNPLNHPQVKVLAGLLRALIGWAVLVALVSWTYIKIPIWMTDALKGGTGFTSWRAIVGALPAVGIAVMAALVVAGGALILTGPTVLWAFADPYLMGSAGSALVDVRSIVSTYGGTGAANMISLIDACCPTGLCMTAFFNWVALQVGGQAICAGLIALSKVLAS